MFIGVGVGYILWNLKSSVQTMDKKILDIDKKINMAIMEINNIRSDKNNELNNMDDDEEKKLNLKNILNKEPRGKNNLGDDRISKKPDVGSGGPFGPVYI